MHSIHKGKVLFVCFVFVFGSFEILVCIFIKVVKNFEVNVDVQKSGIKFKEIFDNRIHAN